MLKFMTAVEKTNSYRPVPWALTDDPFPAFRGEGHRHRAFYPFHPSLKLEWADGVAPDKKALARLYPPAVSAVMTAPCRVVKTKKGGDLIVPATPEQDEKILFVTLLGGFRGAYSRIDVVNGELLYLKKSGGHCVETGHLVARLDDNGYVVTETGRRSTTGIVEVFTWGERKKLMTPEEFDAWEEMWV